MGLKKETPVGKISLVSTPEEPEGLPPETSSVNRVLSTSDQVRTSRARFASTSSVDASLPIGSYPTQQRYSARSRASKASRGTAVGAASHHLTDRLNRLTVAVDNKLNRRTITSKVENRCVVLLRRFMDSSFLEVAVWCLTCCDIGLLFCALHRKADQGDSLEWIFISQASLLAFFVMELLARWSLADLRKRCSEWLLWDTLLILTSLVLLCILGFRAPLVGLPRMLRLFRIAFSGKLTFGLRPLLLLLGTLYHSLGFLMFGALLLVINILIFSVLGMEVLQVSIGNAVTPAVIERFGKHSVEESRYAFSSLLSSITTLFALSAGDKWHDVAYPIVIMVPGSLAFFMAYFFLSFLAISGSVFAALMEGQKTWTSNQVWLEQQAIERDKEKMIDRLEDVFEELDTDGSGAISYQEFYHNRNVHPEFSRIMAKFDLDERELDHLWSILDVDMSGSVDQGEFIDLMQRLQSSETKWQVVRTGHLTSQVYERCTNLRKQIQSGFEAVQGALEVQAKTIDQCTSNLANSFNQSAVRASTAYLVDEAQARTSTTTHETAGDSGPSNGTPAASVPDVHPAPGPLETSLKCSPEDSQTVVDAGTASSTNTRDVNKKVSESAQVTALRLAEKHLRGVPSNIVAMYGRQDVIDYWDTETFAGEVNDKQNMLKSFPTKRCDFFISHCWSVPKDWHQHFKANNMYETYAYKKALELHSVIKQSLSESSQKKDFPDVVVWIDKSCIPQRNQEVRELCVGLIEEFLRLSDGMIVLFTWNYFTRLWCVYEWACFLRQRHPLDLQIRLGCDAFLKASPDDTLPKYLESIEKLSVKGAKCFHPGDHAALEEKVFEYYKGETKEEAFANFECFARSTAMVLISKQVLLWRACKTQADEDAWMGPIRALAERLGDQDLCRVLNAVQPSKWYEGTRDEQALKADLEYWYKSVAAHYLLVAQEKAVRRQYLTARKARDKFSELQVALEGPNFID